MYFDRLEKNLIDIIKEEQAKLGFAKKPSACTIHSVP